MNDSLVYADDSLMYVNNKKAVSTYLKNKRPDAWNSSDRYQ